MKNFAGLLYYDESENEHLDVADFIVRDDAVSFAFDSVSAEFGRWKAAGLARLSEGNVFRAEQIIPSQRGVPGDPWAIEFRVELVGDSVYVEGMINADRSTHPFSGDLDRKINVR